MSSILLEFLGSNLVYPPGDKIGGIVKVLNETDFKMNSLKVRFRGKSHTGWYEATKKSYVEDEEYYVDHVLVLWLPDNLPSGSVLNAGTHNFPFEFEVPKSAPCSFEESPLQHQEGIKKKPIIKESFQEVIKIKGKIPGSLGWIRYSIYVMADFPDRFVKEKKVLVTVLPKADLNLDPRAKLSPFLELKEGIGFLSTKFVTINASINKGGYVPGEPLDVILDVDNASDKDVSEIKVVLEEKAAFIGKAFGSTHRRVEKRAAGRAVEDFLIKSKSQRIWHGKLKVPSLPPSDLPGCSIIDLQYRLLFKLKCGTFHKISFKMPFIIGTIPIMSNAERNDAAPELVDEPPSYMECVFGAVDGIEDEREELISPPFSPLYGYYPFGSAV